MKRTLVTTGAALAFMLIGGMSTPQTAAAKEAASVCQFYKGDPLCKTVTETYCVGGSVGIEGRVCRTTTEYWYWS